MNILEKDIELETLSLDDPSPEMERVDDDDT